MKTEQEMIDKIYEVIADKELSFGCKIKFEHNWIKTVDIYLENTWEYFDCISEKHISYDNEPYTVIGHNVMIGDVFEWTHNEQRIMDKNSQDYEWYYILWGMSRIRTSLANIWWQPRKPIESQNKETIEYVYNLIK